MTATSTYPLVAWGSADDISAYANKVNTTVTGGQADPFGGTSAYQLDDTSAAAEAYVSKSFTSTNTVIGIWMLKAGTAAATSIRFWDNTGATSIFNATITWSTVTVSASTGSVYGPVSLGNSWYAFLGVATGAVAGHTVHYLVNPAGAASHTPTGTVYQYVRNAVLLDYPDNMTSWPEPREGSATAQAPSGAEDAWTVGTDYHLGGDIRWVPDSPTDTPAIVSGWYGDNESTGVNCGVAAMLTAGRDKQALVWVKDRSDCTTYVSGYLVQPMNGRPELEGNWRRKFGIELRSTSVYRGY